MRRSLASFVAVAVVLVAASTLLSAGVAAQGKPNFTGKWTLTEGGGPLVAHHTLAVAGEATHTGRVFYFFNGPGAPGPDFIGGRDFEMTQDATALKVRYVGSAPTTLTYALDGSVNRNVPPQGADAVVTSIAEWSGNSLVINSDQTIKTPQGPSSVYLKQTLSIAADGTLVVETRRGSATSTKAVYKK